MLAFLYYQVAGENLQAADELHAEKLAAEASVERVRVSITSAASPLALHVAAMIAAGGVFGPSTDATVTLCDTDASTAATVDLASRSVATIDIILNIL